MPTPTLLLQLNRALAEFYSPGLATETLIARTFALTSRLLDFSLNSHGVLDHATGELHANFDCELPALADAFVAFGRHMRKYAPFRFDPHLNDGKPYSARDFYGQTAFRDLDIYQEVYRPMRFTDHCFVHVPSSTGSTVFVGFMRDGRPFDADEKQLLAAIQPHLANGRELAHALTSAKDLLVTPELFGRVGFTPRQSEVLFWLTQGKDTSDIARILRLRADSVRRLLQAVYAKLGVNHRGAATVKAIALARQLLTTEPSARTGVLLHVATRT
ncbi:helix-turn-helix transcriptional regulator [Labilithrix luteola]|nr:helix-turn-helix domain-containing protein [Labilithrix luteola]